MEGRRTEMRTITKQVFTFDELSDKAKEKARGWFRSRWTESDFSCVIDDAITIGEMLGITFDVHAVPLYGGGTRHEENIWWSLGYVQGDYACFEGNYRYKAGSVAEVKSYAPVDTTSHRIAERLQRVQKENFWQIRARVRGSDSWYNTVDVYREDEKEMAEAAEQEVKDCLRSFAQWIYNQLKKEDEYQSSEEAVDEALMNGEYEFYENGEVV
jgi:hypothetical protein